MQEIEVKILEIDRKQLEEKLSNLGAKLEFDIEMMALFFDWEDGSITQTGQVLRLRKEGTKTILTHKKAIASDQAKIMHETETEIADIEAMQAVFNQLGLLTIKKTRKFRAQYIWKQSHIVIDDYQDELSPIPVFLEIESPNVEELYEVVKALEYSREDCKNWNTYDLVKHYIDT